jgi:hypothetical protein
VTQQRFDLYLASEGAGELALAASPRGIEAALQRELAQGNLDLPPCTTLDEWNAFRGGFNQLLYTRFGLTVDDCVPVDLGEHARLARELLARAAAAWPVPSGWNRRRRRRRTLRRAQDDAGRCAACSSNCPA